MGRVMRGQPVIAGHARGTLLVTQTPLSFWGGYDYHTGEIIDRRHPLAGMCAAGRVLAVPFTAVRERLELAGDVAGKLIIDCTNPIAPGLRPVFDNTTSGAEQIAGWAPRARVVKAFNTTGAENMADPLYNGQAATMFICGDDELGKGATAQLAEELGFEVVDAGALSAARHLENLALLWIHLARVTGLGRDVAFRLMRR